MQAKNFRTTNRKALLNNWIKRIFILTLIISFVDIAHAQVTNPSGTYCFKNSTHRIHGDGGATLKHYSNHSTATTQAFYDKEGTRYGQVYGSGNGVNFGLLDGDGNWSYLAAKDNYTAFRINNSEKMRILSNGRIGIGATSPKAHLHLGERFTMSSATANGWGWIGNNIYNDGTLRRVASGATADLSFTNDGRIIFRTSAAQGGAGSAITNLRHNMEILNGGGILMYDKLRIQSYSGAGTGFIQTRRHWADANYKFFSIQLDSDSNNGFHIDARGHCVIGTNDPCQVISISDDYRKLSIAGGAAKYGDGYWAGTSDRRLKKNIVSMKESLSKLMKVKLYGYEYKDSGVFRYGVMAQEIQELFPHSIGKIGKAGEEYLTVNPNNIMFTGLKATQELGKMVIEQEEQINDLEAENEVLRAELEAERNRNDEQEARLAAIEALLANQATTTRPANTETQPKPVISSININAADDTPQLEQNIPNPFSQSTTIPYYLPEYTRSATLVIRDMTGKMIAKHTLSAQKGEGKIQVNIDNAQLRGSTYSYSLYVNDQLINTKKMTLLTK